MTGLPILVAAAGLLAVWSCAPVGPRTPALPGPISGKRLNPEELVRNLIARDRELRSLRALATVDYRSRAGRGSAAEAVLVDRPDRLRLETLSHLGAELIVTAAANEIAGFHPRERVLYRGSSSKENLSRYTQIPLELDEVTRLLMGLPPVDLGGPWLSGENAVTWQGQGGREEKVFFHPDHGAPVRWQRFNAEGEIEIVAEFSDFAPTEAGLFPMKLSFDVPEQRLKLAVRYREPELNAALPASAFVQETPASVREVPLDSMGS